MNDDDARADALRAWFLGPRAENAALLERLVVESLRDHVFWRRNYHPEDGFTIREADKRREGYEDAVATLTQELLGLLAELKRDVPVFSGRYKGHMLAEQTIAAQVGWFATMLYNPNNIAMDISPVTTRLEMEVAAQLARMIGYDQGTSWGHLTSGGTIANFEAFWLARGLRYLPVAAAGAAAELGLALPVATADGSRADLSTLSLWQLLNIPNRATLDLWDALWAAAPRADVARALGNHSLATIGYQEYSRRLAFEYGDPLPPGVVLVSATAHYSWEKIVRALGIGSNQLVHVAVDTRFRMDPDALWAQVRALAGRRQAVVACVSVCGSTEESAVDRLDQVLEVRARAERELGVTFHLHSDACYGGYAAAVTRSADGRRRDASAIRASVGEAWPSDEWVRAVEALGEADSISVDPHKLGYVPYSAGAVLVRDGRARHLVATDPPYLAPERRRAARRRAVSRAVHPGGLQARRGRRRGVAQPQGAAAGRAGLRLSDRAHGCGGPAAAPLPRGRGLLALPGHLAAGARHQHRLLSPGPSGADDAGGDQRAQRANLRPDEPQPTGRRPGVHHHPHSAPLADVRRCGGSAAGGARSLYHGRVEGERG